MIQTFIAAFYFRPYFLARLVFYSPGYAAEFLTLANFDDNNASFEKEVPEIRKIGIDWHKGCKFILS